jgi:hypothetical protein
MQQHTTPPLAEGEVYAGAIGDTAGNVHHVILLPGDNDDASWQQQKEWAASIGGELPTRLEQALLWQNCREHFKREWYWSGEEAASAGWAWCQHFSYGTQSYDLHYDQLRARAVRRLIIE